jgi:hypothetical protein
VIIKPLQSLNKDVVANQVWNDPLASYPKIVHESSTNIIQDGELKEVQGLDHFCFST